MFDDMGRKFYLWVATVTFVISTLGADVVARTSIGGQGLGQAFTDHVYWAAVQFVGTCLLFAPFLGTAFICARIDKDVRTRIGAAIFAAAMLTLLYFYFEGYSASQQAMLDQKWTAAALSVGLLPFFIGIPLMVVVVLAGIAASSFHGRKPS